MSSSFLMQFLNLNRFLDRRPAKLTIVVKHLAGPWQLSGLDIGEYKVTLRYNGYIGGI